MKGIKNIVKAFLFVVIGCTFSQAGISQKDSSFSRWTVGLEGSADNYNFKFNSHDLFLVNNPLYGWNVWNYSAGFAITYHCGKRIFIKSGEVLSRIGFEEQWYDDNNFGPKVLMNSYYLEIPTEIGVNLFIRKKIKIALVAGTKTAIPVMEDWPFPAVINEWIYSSLNADITLFKRTRLYVAPYLQYDMTQLYSSPWITKNTVAYGLSLTLGRDF